MQILSVLSRINEKMELILLSCIVVQSEASVERSRFHPHPFHYIDRQFRVQVQNCLQRQMSQIGKLRVETQHVPEREKVDLWFYLQSPKLKTFSLQNSIFVRFKGEAVAAQLFHVTTTTPSAYTWYHLPICANKKRANLFSFIDSLCFRSIKIIN